MTLICHLLKFAPVKDTGFKALTNLVIKLKCIQ
jgi:hypothetical protein